MTNRQRKAELYRAANLECARIVAGDLQRYQGETQQLAAMVLAKAETTPIGVTGQAVKSPGPLFRTEAA